MVDTLNLEFRSGACPDADIRLIGVEGREAISQLFEFDLLLTSDEPLADDVLADMLHKPCAIALGGHGGDQVHGLLSEVWEIDTSQSKTPRYIAKLVPTVWLLTQAANSRVFQHVTVPDLVRRVVGAYGLKDPTDFRVFELNDSLERDHVVQYQESDWDFLQRWLEHEGRFYWFEHGSQHEALVIADNNAECGVIAEPANVSYRGRNNLATGAEATVWDFDRRQRRVPARVVVSEYNHRTPAEPLIAQSEVDGVYGFGTVVLHHQHFRSREQGDALAKIRAEQIACERSTIHGRADCARFRVGLVFELEDHPNEDRNGRYLITSLQHSAGYAVRDEREYEGDAPLRPYQSTFTAIEVEVPYRPALRTPAPRIHGIVTGHISADGSGEVADIDAKGRYRVRMTYDLSAPEGSKTSRWIRMAQPYVGVGHGTHHPLRKGAEVLIAHVDGDPDRPVIVGAVANAHTVGPTTSANPTQSVTQTASGIRFVMEDMQS